MFVTERGMCLNAYKDDIPVQGRISAGVGGINLDDGDRVIYAGQIDGDGEMIIATTVPAFKRVICSQIDPLARRRKGVKIAELGAEDKVLFAEYVTEPYKLALESEEGELMLVDTEDISIEKRTTKGKALKQAKNVKLKGVYKFNVL